MPGLLKRIKKLTPAEATKLPISSPVAPSTSTSSSTDSSPSTFSSNRNSGTTSSSVASAPVTQKRPGFHEINIQLTPEDAVVVKESWKETIAISPANQTTSNSGSPSNLFCNQFYQNLFAVRPDLEFMFPDVARQSAAISGLFSVALAMLESIEALDEILERMGRRHAYVMGIEAEHFELLGVIFIQTLRDRLAERFTPQIEITWIKIYSYLASKMIAAGQDDYIPVAAKRTPPPAASYGVVTTCFQAQNQLRQLPKTRIGGGQIAAMDRQAINALFCNLHPTLRPLWNLR
ncbi:globin-like protein [Lipomyces arxii]|uniref:globin-like protein n=1 Tax=Lipomyces arxii TaxID=56418 RepID=UPI0034CE81A1